MHTAPDFPQPTRVGGRLMFDRYDVEQHKRQLMGLAPTDRDPSAPIVFVTAGQISNELQINRRTLGRRVKGRIRGGRERRVALIQNSARGAPESHALEVK